MNWPGATGEPVEIAVESAPWPVTRLSQDGGNFPNWAGTGILEWGSANAYFRHDISTGKTDTVEVQLEVPRRMAQGAIALTGARIVTMNGDRVIERGDIVIRDGRIVDLASSGSITIPADAELVDVSGSTIIPLSLIHISEPTRPY